MSFISWRIAVPTCTAAAESPGAYANGLATISRGAFVTAWVVRAPRGMPCAARGADTAAATAANPTKRDRYILDLPYKTANSDQRSPALMREPVGEEGFEPPTSCV